MTGKALQAQNRKSLILLSGRAYPELAEQIATELGVALMATSAYDFANGEIYVRYEDSVRGSDAFVIQSHTAPINEVVLTNTLPIPPERQIDGMTVLSIAPLIARAIREVFEDGSVTSLFDGAS